MPHLLKSSNAHVLTLSPPLNLSPRWLGAHPAYTLSKYGMTLLTLGWAEEFAGQGISFNCLWPETLIATAAVQNVIAGEVRMKAAAAVKASSSTSSSTPPELRETADIGEGPCPVTN